MATEFRIQKINQLILEEITKIIKFDLAHPDISVWTTVLEVQTTPDLSFSRIFISVMDSEEEQKKTVAALNHSRGFIKKHLAKTIRLKKFPELRFQLIGTQGSMENIQKLLDSISTSKTDDNKPNS